MLTFVLTLKELTLAEVTLLPPHGAFRDSSGPQHAELTGGELRLEISTPGKY